MWNFLKQFGVFWIYRYTLHCSHPWMVLCLLWTIFALVSLFKFHHPVRCLIVLNIRHPLWITDLWKATIIYWAKFKLGSRFCTTKLCFHRMVNRLLHTHKRIDKSKIERKPEQVFPPQFLDFRQVKYCIHSWSTLSMPNMFLLYILVTSGQVTSCCVPSFCLCKIVCWVVGPQFAKYNYISPTCSN